MTIIRTVLCSPDPNTCFRYLERVVKTSRNFSDSSQVTKLLENSPNLTKSNVDKGQICIEIWTTFEESRDLGAV